MDARAPWTGGGGFGGIGGKKRRFGEKAVARRVSAMLVFEAV